MLNYCRKAAGITAVWLAVLGVLTVWPNAPEAGVPVTGDPAETIGDPLGVMHDVTYSHTGLWVADVREDGTVVYLRQIRRR